MNIILTGSLSVDQIMIFDGLFEEIIHPDKLDTLSIAPLVDKFKRSPGGTSGNIAYSLALLGEKPILYSSIGSESKTYINNLSKIGVDTSLVHYSSLPTATFSVLTDKNNCQVGGFYPGAMSESSSLLINKFKDDDVLIVISAHDPKQMAIQSQECITLKKRMVYDVGQQVLVLNKKDLELGIKAAEILIVNEYEMSVISKKIDLSKEDIIKQTKITIVTLGEKGSVIYAEKDNWNPLKVKAANIKKVIDPTGAGDAFRAGFLYGFVRDWSLQQSARLGSITASFAIENHGTQEHKLNWPKIKNRYKQTYSKELILN